MKKYCILLVIIIGTIFTMSAQEHFVDGVYGTAIKAPSVSQAGTIIQVEDQYQQCRIANNCPYAFELQETKLYTKLYFDESLRNYYASDWKLQVEYEIDLFEYSSSPTNPTSITQSLEIDYHPTEKYKDIDAFVYDIPTGFYTKAEVRITKVIVTDKLNNPTTVLQTPLPDDIHFDVNLEVDRAYTLNPFSKPRVNTFSNSTGINTALNTYTISWDFMQGTKEYDVEWLFVAMGNSPKTDEFFLDFKNATRVTTQQHFYDISLAYPRGFIIWRVRGIGLEKSDPTSTIFDKRLEGAWSFSSKGYYKQNGVDLVPTSGTTSGNSRYASHNFFWDGLEKDKNWQYNVVYAEDGKRKEVINFYDDILKPEQTVTLLNTDNTAVVAEPIYDFIGRNSMQVLPAPQKSKGIRHYNPLHKNQSGTNYSYENFDLDPDQTNTSPPHINKPEKLSSQGNLGAGYYYSSQNNDPLGINGGFTPDAQGYPYSRTIYKNDGSGRIKAVSGVGKEYFSNGGKLTHKTKFLYGSPFQEELTMLFGNNVGFAKYYEKTVAIDANGQASASVKDLSGRVIMTSLAGEAPDNLKNIDSKPSNPISLQVNLNQLNALTNDAVTVNKVLLAVGSTRYDFIYELSRDTFIDCGVNTPCVYDLEIYLKDEYGEKVALSYQGGGVSEIALKEIKMASTFSFSASVNAGSYQLIKKLTINEKHLDEAVTKWVNNQTCYQPRKIDPIESCNPDCTSLCEESYWSVPDAETGIHYYLAIDDGRQVAQLKNGNLNNIIDQQGYDDVVREITKCKDACEAHDPTAPPMSECEFKKELLKQDMSPGGQYFDNIVDLYLPAPNENTLNSNYDKDGWLNKISEQEFYKLRDCLGIDEGKREGLFDDLRNNWKPEYADILVMLHPEWCAYQTLCCGEAICDAENDDNFKTNSTNNIPSDESNQKACNPLTPADQTQIDTWLVKTDFDTQSEDVLKELGASADTATKNEFTPKKLKDRARRFYEEYLKYKKVKQACPALHLQSPDSTGFTSEGFAIRYPYNEIFENFDPNNPQAFQEQIQKDNCEKAAEQAADKFIARLKNNCDVLSKNQEDELWKHVYSEYLLDCQDASITVDLNASIREFISCSSMLPEACFVEALPEQTDDSCGCKKINAFVVDIVQSVAPKKSYLDIVGDLSYGSSQEVQDALDSVLYPDDLHLKSEFASWYKACNSKPHYSWKGGTTSPPAELASYFSCEEEEIEEPIDPDKECVEVFNAFAQAIADLEFEQLMKQKAAEFRTAYKAHCLNQAFTKNETFNLDYLYNEYHYTLYYYDQAGDLVATVPPDGIFQKDSQTGTVYHDSRITNTTIHQKAMDYLRNPTTGQFVDTQHLIITNYQYNSLQNVITQHTPDGGKSKFWYDALGRMAVSQNANQLTRDAFSYLQYDQLGRTVEAGELEHSRAMSKTIAEDINDYNIPVLNGGRNLLLNWLDSKTATNEKTTSFYDAVDPSIVDATHSVYNQQNYLRNRISAVGYDNNGDNSYDALTHYSYDVLGNVETLWQENKGIPQAFAQHRVKRLDYTYDLVSGNVNQVSYQKDKADQFMHRYSYDADNRLVKVNTSVDDVIWETEARYFYYAHGPLAREEIGDKIVFANDYVYDIRGWITAMNASMVDANRDAGKDGIQGGLNENVGRDPFAFSLHYFKNHYQPISSSNSNVIVKEFGAIDIAHSQDLYNGNIAKMVTSLKNLAQEPIEVMANAYRYDQLNRIKSFKPYWDEGTNKPLADNAFEKTNARNENEYYNANYWFDGNGNIERLKRNSIKNDNLPNEKMDDMYYGYNKVQVPEPIVTANALTTNAKVNNQLFHVKDAITTAGYDIDIESGQTANNYKYDEIGRLVQDQQEEIKQINWNVSNKVTSFEKSNLDDDVYFAYGPMGNRIGKFIKKKSSIAPVVYDANNEVQTFYMLDAQGNPLAIYKYDAQSGTLTLEDFIIYGNKRLGTNTKGLKMN